MIINHYKEELEGRVNKHNFFMVYRKVKEIPGIFIPKKWERHILEVYDGNAKRECFDNQNCTQGPKLIKPEVKYALKSAKCRKASGSDEISVETVETI